MSKLLAFQRKSMVEKKVSMQAKSALIGLCVLGLVLCLVSFCFWKKSSLHTLWTVSVYFYLIPLAYIDRKFQIIPNKALPIGLILALFYIFIDSKMDIKNMGDDFFAACAGLIFGGGVFAFAALFSKGGVGMGDIKLFGVLGFILGFRLAFSMIFFTLLCSALFGICLLAIKKVEVKTRIPVAPFALAGTALMILTGG